MNPLDKFCAKDIFFVDNHKEFMRAWLDRRQYPVILSKTTFSNPDIWSMLAFDLHCSGKTVVNA